MSCIVLCVVFCAAPLALLVNGSTNAQAEANTHIMVEVTDTTNTTGAKNSSAEHLRLTRLDSLRRKEAALRAQSDSLERLINAKANAPIIIPPMARLDSLRLDADRLDSAVITSIAASSHRVLHSTFFELLGCGGFFSFNYDNRFARNWSMSVGVGLLSSIPWGDYSGGPKFPSNSVSKGFEGDVTIPIMLHYLTHDGTSPGHLDVGIGVTPWFGREVILETIVQSNWNGQRYTPPQVTYNTTSTPQIRVFLPISISYRYQPLNTGFFFRIGVAGLVAETFGFTPWGGIAIGSTFP